MTVSTTINREQYATDGVTTVFTIHFAFFDDTNVNAILVDSGGTPTTLSLNTDFTAAATFDADGNPTGGTATLTVAPATGGTLTLFREIPFTQESKYVENDPFPAARAMGDFDLAVIRDQQLDDLAARSLSFPVSIAPGVSAELPSPVADQVLGWNGAAAALENKNLPAGTAVYSSIATTRAGTSTAEAVTPDGLASFWQEGIALVSAATVARPSDANLGGYYTQSGSTGTNNYGAGVKGGEEMEIRYTGAPLLGTSGNLLPPTGSAFQIIAGDIIRWRWDASATKWRAVGWSRLDASPVIAGLPTGFLRGLTMANGTDANNDIDIAAGSARDSTDAASMVLAATITKQLDAGWAAGTNAGGLDTGAKANSTWYHVWLIKRTDTGVVDVLYSTSATAPTMPASYTVKRRIGAVLTDGSGNIRAFLCYGSGATREFHWATAIVSADTAAPGTTAVSRTVHTPLGLKTKALLMVGAMANANTTMPTHIVTDLAGANVAPDAYNAASVTNAPDAVSLPFTVGASWGWGKKDVWTDASSQVRSRASASDATARIAIATRGWIEDL